MLLEVSQELDGRAHFVSFLKHESEGHCDTNASPTDGKRLTLLCSSIINSGYLERFFLLSSDMAEQSVIFVVLQRLYQRFMAPRGETTHNHYL